MKTLGKFGTNLFATLALVATFAFIAGVTFTPPAANAQADYLVGVETGTATSTAAAATLNTTRGQITTEALTTAGLADYTFTLTNSKIKATSSVRVSIKKGTDTTGTIALGTIAPAAGTCVIIVHNLHATVAFNGTLVLDFLVVN